MLQDLARKASDSDVTDTKRKLDASADRADGEVDGKSPSLKRAAVVVGEPKQYSPTAASVVVANAAVSPDESKKGEDKVTGFGSSAAFAGFGATPSSSGFAFGSSSSFPAAFGGKTGSGVGTGSAFGENTASLTSSFGSTVAWGKAAASAPATPSTMSFGSVIGFQAVSFGSVTGFQSATKAVGAKEAVFGSGIASTGTTVPSAGTATVKNAAADTGAKSDDSGEESDDSCEVRWCDPAVADRLLNSCN